MAKNREFSLIAAYDELKKHIPNLRQKKRGCKPLDRLIKIYFFTAPSFFVIMKPAKKTSKIGGLT